MAHSVRLSDFAYKTYLLRAEALGLTLEQYLDRSARVRPEPDGFVFTPEVEAAIRRGMADVAAGRTTPLSEVREHFASYRTKWQESDKP